MATFDDSFVLHYRFFKRMQSYETSDSMALQPTSLFLPMK